MTEAALTRDDSIDRLRSVMTALVILHHTAITYGGSGGWFWKELDTSASASSILLTLFCATNQAYFMGFFFLLAGYFTPGSLEKKGYARFLKDRCLRLGVPLLAFILILGPLTAAMVTAAEGHGFWPTLVSLWQRQRIINGPLWFAQALLMFSAGYAVWRKLSGAGSLGKSVEKTSVPAYWVWLLSAFGTAAMALVIRQFVPVGENVFGLQLGYFAGYIFLFALGTSAWRHDWIRQLEWRHARPWIWTLILAWPTLPVAIAIARTSSGHGKVNFGGGLSWPAILYALWEPLVAWGLISGWLLVARRFMDEPSALWDWLNRRAYAVYILHPPILVGIALLLHGWHAPALVKFALTGSLTCVACCLVSAPIVRIPGVRRIV